MLTASPAATGRPARDRLLTLVRAPRIIIDFFAPFDRPIVLSSLGSMGLILGFWSTGEFTGPVLIIGYSLAGFTFAKATHLFLAEKRDRRLDRRVRPGTAQIGENADDYRFTSAA